MSELESVTTQVETADDVAETVEETVVDETVAAPADAPVEETGDEEYEAIDYDDDYETEDSLTFSNGVIEKIVAIAMRDVPGVIGMKGGWVNRMQDLVGAHDPRKGVVVEVTPESSVRVNISVMIEYGAYAPQVFEDVKRTVVKQVTGMTGLEVAGVNLRIEDVLTPEEYAAKNHSQRSLPENDEETAVPEIEAVDDEPAAELED